MFIGNLNSVGNMPIGGGTSYLLDTYTAAAAYSLRQLKTGVTNVVRVRRSSDSAESDFTATEITDGTLTTWTGANDGFVVTWYDQSGSGYDLTQVSAAAQPFIVSSGTLITDNSKACIQNNAAANHNLNNTSVSVSIAQRSHYSVFSMQTQKIDGRIYSFNVGTGSDFNKVNSVVFQQGNSGRNDEFGVFGSSSTSYFLSKGVRSTVTTQTLVCDEISGTTGTLYQNGSSVATDTSFTAFTTSTRLYIGAGLVSGSVGNYGDIKYQEFIFFDTDQSSNRAAIESDINTYYSIY
jgi:hypothetical protein